MTSLIEWLPFQGRMNCSNKYYRKSPVCIRTVSSFCTCCLFCWTFSNWFMGRLGKATNTANSKVSFFHQCSKTQIIPIKKFNIQTCFFQFLWFFRLKCWFQGQIIPRIHLILPNAYTQMCFDRNINGNRDVKFLIGIIGHCTDERNLLYK